MVGIVDAKRKPITQIRKGGTAAAHRVRLHRWYVRLEFSVPGPKGGVANAWVAVPAWVGRAAAMRLAQAKLASGRT